jgi:hypothetical protein
VCLFSLPGDGQPVLTGSGLENLHHREDILPKQVLRDQLDKVVKSERSKTITYPIIGSYIKPDIMLIIMPEQTPVTAKYCGHCGASINLDAKYCSCCGTGIPMVGETHERNAKRDNDFGSRISSLESKLDEIKYRISQNNRILNKKSPMYIDRLLDYMPTYYVTLVSIIQSIALGLLFAALFNEVSGITRGTFDPIWTILIIGTFFIIISIWITYTRTVPAMRVIPQTLDAIIPFFFGLTQALAIFCISLHEIAWFYFSLSSCAGVAILQYIHSFRQARFHYENNREFLEKMGPWDRKAIMMAVIRGSIFIVFGLSEAFLKLKSLYFAIFFLLINVLLIIFLHRSFKELSKY